MEVHLAGSEHVKWTQLRVRSHLPTAADPCSLPPSPALAGSISLGSPSFHHVVWRVHKLSPAILELLELDDFEAHISGLRLSFEEPLSSFLSIYPEQVHSSDDERMLCVCAITISGIVYVLQVRRFYKYRNMSSFRQSETVQFSLAGDMAQLDDITSFAASGGSICVGGKSGSVLCYPFEHVSGSFQDHGFELKDSEALLGRLWGLMARAKNASPVKSMNLQKYEERLILFALHGDGTFKLWDVHDQTRLLSVNLQKELGDCPLKKMWIQEQDSQCESPKLAFWFENIENQREGTLQVYELHFSHIEGTASLNLLIQFHHIQGIILDLRLLSESMWKLGEIDGQYSLTHYLLESMEREVHETCILLEDELETQLFQKSSDNWEELLLFQLSIVPGTKNELQFPVSELFLARILQPGIFQQDVLLEVLQKYRRISETEFQALTREGICKEILAVIEAEHTGDFKQDNLMAWKAFCMEYFRLWKQRNKPCVLLFDNYTGSIGIVRQRSLSVRRSSSDFEKNYKGGRVKIGDGIDFWGILFRCISNISRQLGRLPLSAFGQCLLGNKHASLSYICSVFLHLLDVGYDYSVLTTATNYGVDTGRKKKTEYQSIHRKLELQLTFDLYELRDGGGGWEKVLDNVDKYLNQLFQDTKISVAGDAFEGLECGIISKRLVLNSTTQLSWFHFEAARDILLLLSYILSIKGQVGLNTLYASKLLSELLTKAKRILWLSLLVHWLGVSYAEQEPSEDFSLHLSCLQLDSIVSEKPSSKITSAAETTLAEILMFACTESPLKDMFLKPKGLVSSEKLTLITKVFVYWIIWGDSGENVFSVSNRAISLATILLRHGQYAHLQSFLSIVDNICNEIEPHEVQNMQCDWSARLHILGCALLGQTRMDGKTTNANRIESAVQCFFRVATFVGKSREEFDAFFVKSGMQTRFPTNGSVISRKFQYLEWVMEIFEQNGVSEGASRFGYAALQEIQEAESSSIMDTTGPSYDWSIVKGRLWANIFKFSLDQKNFHEAYCAIASNPDQESKYTCLRRLLIVLLEQKEAEVLCGSRLPYVGMLDRVEQELLLKANYSDVTAYPNPFKLLYAFHVQRHNWRRAALYMYLYFVRMKGTEQIESHLATTVLSEQLRSLAAAINALNLVDPTSAWLDLESDICNNLSCRPMKRIRLHADNDGAYTGQKCIELKELEKEYTLTSAKLLLVENGVQLGGGMSPSIVLSMLVQSDLYEMAFTLLLQFWNGSSLECELERVFQIIAKKWCLNQQENQFTTLSRRMSESEKKLLILPPERASDRSHLSSQVIHNETSKDSACNALQFYLHKYAKLHSHLPVIVAETMLDIDRLVELPVWLVDMLKGGRQAYGEGMSFASADPGALLRIYLDYGRISEAAILFMEFVKAWTNLPPSHIIKRKRMCSVWFPYMLVDRLKDALSELKKSEQFGNLQKLLDGTLCGHFNQAQIDSIDVKSLVKC